MNFGEYLKMFGRKSRDLLVKVATCQDAFEKKFDSHVLDEKEIFKGQTIRFDDLEELIMECHGTCSEEGHIKKQNGTLLRMEKKYDVYMEDQAELKNQVAAMKTVKKTRRQVWADIGKIVVYIGIVCGIVFGILRYSQSTKFLQDQKIEVMLKELLDK